MNHGRRADSISSMQTELKRKYRRRERERVNPIKQYIIGGHYSPFFFKDHSRFRLLHKSKKRVPFFQFLGRSREKVVVNNRFRSKKRGTFCLLGWCMFRFIRTEQSSLSESLSSSSEKGSVKTTLY